MNSAKVILVTYPDDFSLQEAQSLVESSSPSMAPRPQIVKAFTQKYLNHSRYGLGSGKADEIKNLGIVFYKIFLFFFSEELKICMKKSEIHT